MMNNSRGPTRRPYRRAKRPDSAYRVFRNLLLVYTAMIIISIGLIVGSPRPMVSQSVQAVARSETRDQPSLANRVWSEILRLFTRGERDRGRGGLPDRSSGHSSPEPAGIVARVMKAAMVAMGGLDPADPRTFVRAEVPFFLPEPRDVRPSRRSVASRSDMPEARVPEPAPEPAAQPEAEPAPYRETVQAEAPEPVPVSERNASPVPAVLRDPAAPVPKPRTAEYPLGSNPESMAVLGSRPRVAILHSHSSEAYRRSWGADYAWGKPDGVVAVGWVLAQELHHTYGVSTVHSRKVHDYPDWNKSYVNSMATMRDILSRYSTVEMVLDLHRDSLPVRSETLKTVSLDGQRVARVLIVVTDDSSGMPHPGWRRNYQFALKLNERINKLYPGLSRGVAINTNGRLNLHLHSQAIIMEIGGTENTREEAELAARLIARAIAEVL